MYRQLYVFDNPRQYTAVEYYQAAEEFAEMLSFFIPGLQCHTVKQFTHSSYFDNLDFVVTGNANYRDQLEQALPLLGAKEILSEGDQWSFVWRDVRINIFQVPQKAFEFATHYYAYNQIGELLNCMLCDSDYRIDPNGLWHKISAGEKRLDKPDNDYMLITRDFHMALDILGYSHSVFKNGFASRCDEFKFVTQNHGIQKRCLKSPLSSMVEPIHMVSPCQWPHNYSVSA